MSASEIRFLTQPPSVQEGSQRKPTSKANQRILYAPRTGRLLSQHLEQSHGRLIDVLANALVEIVYRMAIEVLRFLPQKQRFGCAEPNFHWSTPYCWHSLRVLGRGVYLRRHIPLLSFWAPLFGLRVAALSTARPPSRALFTGLPAPQAPPSPCASA
jgi:hypothetical protein